MIRQIRQLSLLATIVAFSACSGVPLPTFGNAEKEAAAAEEKAGRIAMVLEEEVLQADPDLAAETINLPPAEVMSSWAQSGAGSSKVTGHVQAAGEFEIAWRADAGKGSDRRSALTTAPVADTSKIYVVDAAQKVRAFDLNTGARVWQTGLSSNRRRDKASNGSGIALDGNTLVVSSGFGFVTALDASNGSEIWRTEMSAPMTGSPTIKDGLIFATSNNNEIFALNLETGSIEWSDQAIAETARVLGSPSPAAVEDLVVAPFSSGEIIAYLAANGRRLWTDALSRPGRFTPISSINDVSSRPVLAGGVVFASSQSGVTTAIDGRSGNRVWIQPVGSVQAPALAGNTLFVASTEAEVVAMQAGTGNVYWVTKLDEYGNVKKRKDKITYSGPIIASNRVIVASSTGQLISLDPQTGTENGRLSLKAPVFIEPIAANGLLILLADNGKLIAIR